MDRFQQSATRGIAVSPKLRRKLGKVSESAAIQHPLGLLLRQIQDLRLVHRQDRRPSMRISPFTSTVSTSAPLAKYITRYTGMFCG